MRIDHGGATLRGVELFRQRTYFRFLPPFRGPSSAMDLARNARVSMLLGTIDRSCRVAYIVHVAIYSDC